MKRALLLCSSHNDFGLIRALRKLGYCIIVTGNKSGLPGQKWCDEFIQADYSDKELILSIAKEKRVDAIVQCCNDFGVYTASYVAEQLGLPGYDSYETCLTLHNKDLFKAFCKKHDIMSPVSEGFSRFEEADSYLKGAIYPLIIKPTDCSAGNGISKAFNYDEAIFALSLAFQKSKVGRIVIEPFISGTQHGFCTFLKDKKVVNVCSNNEYSFINPYRVEIDTFPASNFYKVKEVLIDEIEKIASILDLKDGIFHLQYIFDGNKPMIIEVMRRVLGNMYHIPGNLVTGLDWEYWETRVRCGLPIGDMPVFQKQEGCFAYKAVIADKNGIFSSVNVPKSYEKYMFEEYWLKEPGYLIENHQSDPLGFLFFMFPSEQEMLKLLINEYSCKIVDIK